MTQRSMFWNGVSDGDAHLLSETTADGTGYHLSSPDVVSPFVDRFLRAILNGDENRGPLKNWLNELEVTGTGTPISVASGAVIVYGLPYFNTAVVPVSVPTPSTDQRYDRIVVRRNWTTRTARITRLVGVEGGAAPSLVQSPAPGGTGVYDIPLAQLLVSTGGAITVTDEREFCTFSTIAADNAVGNTTVMPGVIGWQARGLVWKSVRLMGADLVTQNPAYFSYSTGTNYLTGNSASAFGSDASYLKGWKASGSGTAAYKLWQANFKVPADYVPGTAMLVYLWWADDWSGATSLVFNFAYQIYDDTLEQGCTLQGTTTATSVSATSVVNTIRRTEVGSVPSSHLQGNGNEMVELAVRYYNAAGSEKIVVLGMEIQYVAYA